MATRTTDTKDSLFKGRSLCLVDEMLRRYGINHIVYVVDLSAHNAVEPLESVMRAKENWAGVVYFAAW